MLATRPCSSVIENGTTPRFKWEALEAQVKPTLRSYFSKQFKVVEQNSHSEIFTAIVVSTAIFQIILLLLTILIWYKIIKEQRKIWTIVFFTATAVYLFIGIYLAIDLYHQDNLKIGGVTFAYEMLSLIHGGIYLGAILLIVVLSKLVK